MSSSARELLKWIALVCMTFDHVAKVFYDGYVPVLSELGRIAFPLFALVMAYNLAQPGADVAKSVRRLCVWGLLAQPFHAWAFGYWVPVNVLLAFALAAAAVWAIQRGRWLLLTLCVAPAPLFVDYQWAGMALVVAGWAYYAKSVRSPWPVVLALAALCWFNGSLWAVLAVPVIALGEMATTRGLVVPRTRVAFYGYYVGHLFVIALLAALPAFQQHVS
ncbi:conjugal transfer protein [Xanthomonas phaseoli pv. phaseoli]|uniref:Conjugal transfer protein n=2 Tax=Xanthomonas TaxID=338 RepID=A0AB34QDG9_XANCH|nr:MULTISPECIES: TraX family protein [Xanthomonas]AZU26003.1 conjugal transfer protein [Xanthomonas phaseoli pv. phaseoli]AZU30359.1 conjugal transfer protein [Xanthomonas sp. ISO98C4]KHD70034.1 conjugal transfer protein [Xanthomonas phaseoli pv. phaseoli]KHS21305.1 conjugal transfer protein [Xanthomonas phaseoli pv. phaseoli]KHS33324.1 conjugal transfer protein [Xanthomonas phaseoli pv. phaseoli]